MSTPNRAALLTKVQKVLKKHYKPYDPPAERTVLQHMLYACCLENARFDAADEAFAKLCETYFDWNEIRVTTVTELSEVISSLPDAQAAAQRIKRALQSVFEANYSFDLEPLKKQNLGKSEKDLEKIHGTTPFIRAYIAQNGLGGHSIPVSTGSVELLYAVGAINDAEADKQIVPGMERAIPKNKGVEFGSLLQQAGADFRASPGSTKLRSMLAEIDSSFLERLTKRAAKVEADAVAHAKAVRVRRAARAAAEAQAAAPPPKGKASKGAAKNSATEKSAADKSAGDKSSAKGKPQPEAAKPHELEKTEKPKKKNDAPAANSKDGKKSASKGLAKKKPR
jgi:endonuclease-3